MLQPGSIFNGRYEIVQVLGVGGYATVYKAVQTDLGRTVALKVYHASVSEDEHFAERCKREALALNSLSHKNIVTVYHIGQSDDDNLLYLVMEFIRGNNLRILINRSERIEIKDAVSIMRSVASALSLAHNNEIVHRDLKPDNVLLSDVPEPNTVKIVDFGLAKILSEKNQKLTQTGELLGTSFYMSPEQCLGKQIDNRSDIFSFGICFYEVLTGNRPFDADTTIGVMYQIMNVDVRKLSNKEFGACSAQLNAILSKCLQKDPVDRYQKMDDLIADLDELSPPHLAIALPPSAAISTKAISAARSENSSQAAISSKHSKQYMGFSPLTAKIFVGILLSSIFVYGAFVFHRKNVSAPRENWSYVPSVCVNSKEFRDRQQVNSLNSDEFLRLLQKKEEQTGISYFGSCISQCIFQYSLDKSLASTKRLEFALDYENTLLNCGFPSKAESFFKYQIKPLALSEQKRISNDSGLQKSYSSTIKILIGKLIDAGKLQSAKNLLRWYLKANEPNESFSIVEIIYSELRMDEPELARSLIKTVDDPKNLSAIIYHCRLFHRMDLLELCLQKLEVDALRLKKPEYDVFIHSAKALNYFESKEPRLTAEALDNALASFRSGSKGLKESDRNLCLQLALALELTGHFKEAHEVLRALATLDENQLEKRDTNVSNTYTNVSRSGATKLSIFSLPLRIESLADSEKVKVLLRKADGQQTEIETRAILQAEALRYARLEKQACIYDLVDSMRKLGLPASSIDLLEEKKGTADSPAYLTNELKRNLLAAESLSYYDGVKMESRLFAAFALAKKLAKVQKDYNFVDFCTADIPLNKYEHKRRIVLGWEVPPDQRDVSLTNKSNFEKLFPLYLQYGQYRMAEDCLTKMRRELSDPQDELARDTLARFENLLKLELKPTDNTVLVKLSNDYMTEPARKKRISPYLFLALSLAGLGIEATKIERRFETLKPLSP